MFFSAAKTAQVNSTINYILLVKGIIFGILFVSFSIYYVKWNNSWFKLHADEEFKLKKYEMDMDRASWIVEMMLEWEIEKGKNIPEALLKSLSKGMFSESAELEEVQHPYEQIATTILGSSSKACINTPMGSLEIDRKGINNLKKAKE